MTHRIAISVLQPVWWRRLLVMVIKELRQLFRDKALIGFFFWAFLADVYLAGSGTSMQLVNAGLVVHDADQTVSSRELVHRFHPPYFRFDGLVDRPKNGLRRLDFGEDVVFLDIPPRFHEMLLGGEATSVQMQIAATHSPQGLSAASYGARIVGEFGLEASARAMGSSSSDSLSLPIVRSDHRIWYNPNQDESWFMSISEVLTVTTIFAVLLPAAALVRERERGTVEQLLVSPLSPFQIMFPKVVAMTLVILAGTTISLFGILHAIFNVPMKGSWSLYFVMTTLYVFTTSGLGLVAATIASNQAQVSLMTILIVAPILLLSGTWTPPEAMPEWLRYLMLLSPLHHFVNISYGIQLKGTGLDILWPSVLSMVALGGSLFGFGMWRFRRQFA
ncbi:MAG: ABC transporter permease [Nitrospira sp.]